MHGTQNGQTDRHGVENTEASIISYLIKIVIVQYIVDANVLEALGLMAKASQSCVDVALKEYGAHEALIQVTVLILGGTTREANFTRQRKGNIDNFFSVILSGS